MPQIDVVELTSRMLAQGGTSSCSAERFARSRNGVAGLFCRLAGQLLILAHRGRWSSLFFSQQALALLHGWPCTNIFMLEAVNSFGVPAVAPPPADSCIWIYFPSTRCIGDFHEPVTVCISSALSGMFVCVRVCVDSTGNNLQDVHSRQ